MSAPQVENGVAILSACFDCLSGLTGELLNTVKAQAEKIERLEEQNASMRSTLDGIANRPGVCAICHLPAAARKALEDVNHA